MVESNSDAEVEAIVEIERLELLARETRRRLEHAASDADRQVLIRQLRELEQQVARVRGGIR